MEENTYLNSEAQFSQILKTLKYIKTLKYDYLNSFSFFDFWYTLISAQDPWLYTQHARTIWDTEGNLICYVQGTPPNIQSILFLSPLSFWFGPHPGHTCCSTLFDWVTVAWRVAWAWAHMDLTRLEEHT